MAAETLHFLEACAHDRPVLVTPEHARMVMEVPSEPDMGTYKPAGAGPFPAIVVFHNCAGVTDHIGDWAKAFVAAGYVAFVIDIYTSRRVRFGENCKAPPPPSEDGLQQ
ncbi:MAG: dienelactone hydrolase family protein [Betaproteobacteria bacterium]